MEKFEIKLTNKLDRSQSLFYFVPHSQAGSTILEPGQKIVAQVKEALTASLPGALLLLHHRYLSPSPGTWYLSPGTSQETFISDLSPIMWVWPGV